jgi:nitroimidazol reductase NimA-like FMN-containing flavoprotein (pyridoxamine 5'-phosphate oxidase superfamily)
MTSPTGRATEAGNVTVLNEEQCRALLGSTGVGRIGFVGPSGPVIHPVNYLVDHDTIVVRTSPYTMLAEHATGDVAFEVDELDAWLTRGWSVLISGQLAPIDDPDETIALRREGALQPWATGQRNLFLRITPRAVSGRRVG